MHSYKDSIVNKKIEKELKQSAFDFFLNPSMSNEFQLQKKVCLYIGTFAMENEGVTSCDIHSQEFSQKFNPEF